MSARSEGELGFVLVSTDPVRLAAFYRDALGFSVEEQQHVPAGIHGLDGDALAVRLRLGAQSVTLLGSGRPGLPYPADSTSHDRWFQHLALVASDIDAAHARLASHSGWTPISRGAGPVQLPESSGGVRAFKFRDPEGHPLELLAFSDGKAPPPWSRSGPADGFLLGIDHSALVVDDLDRSLAFYRRYGFEVSAQSENEGPEQDALDGADAVRVSVRALSRDGGTPHLELLAYHSPAVRDGQAGLADIACTRTVLDATGGVLRDPDGHVLMAAPGG